MNGTVEWAIGVIIVLILFSVPIIPIQEEVTKYTPVPFSCNQTLIDEKQVHSFLWFGNVTQFTYLIKNNELEDGKFTLNYIFSNGSESNTSSDRVKILAGEVKSVTKKSPISGKSTVFLNIVPPYKTLATIETITKNVNVWHFLNPIYILSKLF